MLRQTYKDLNTVQKGRFGEALSKTAFLLEGFEVYTPEYDDRGIDFVVRPDSRPDGACSTFYAVQVKATGDSVNPFIKESLFKTTDDFIFCAVRIVENKPPAIYIAKGSDWATGIGCLHHNTAGGNAGPYYEMRFASEYQNELEKFEFSNYIAKL